MPPGAAAGMGLRAGLQAQAMAPQAGWAAQSSLDNHPVGSASSPENGARLTSQGCCVNRATVSLRRLPGPQPGREKEAGLGRACWFGPMAHLLSSILQELDNFLSRGITLTFSSASLFTFKNPCECIRPTQTI